MSDEVDLGSVITVFDGQPLLFEVTAYRRPYTGGGTVGWRYEFRNKSDVASFRLEVAAPLVSSGRPGYSSDQERLHTEAITFAIYEKRRNPAEPVIRFHEHSYDEFMKRETSRGQTLRDAILSFLWDVYQAWPNQWVSDTVLMYNFNSSLKEIQSRLENLEGGKYLKAKVWLGVSTEHRDGEISVRVNPEREDKVRQEVERIRSAKDSADGKAESVISVFLSYSHRNKTLAGKVKRSLEAYGMRVFMAHEDIEVSNRWKNRILQELRNCDVFVPITTPEFKASDWCDQEAGIALALKKQISPLMGKRPPHGFLDDFQGGRRKRDLGRNASEMAKTISKNPELSARFRGALIRVFGESATADEAVARTERLIAFDGYSAEQLKSICQYAIENSNIRASESSVRRLMPWIEGKSKPIGRELLRRVREAFSK